MNYHSYDKKENICPQKVDMEIILKLGIIHSSYSYVNKSLFSYLLKMSFIGDWFKISKNFNFMKSSFHI